MKKLFTLFISLISYLSLSANAGTFEYYLNTKISTGSTQNHGDYGGGTSFNGSNIGTISNISTTLVIELVGLKTFEDNGSEVLSARMNYRVYEQGTTPGAFIAHNLPQKGAKSGNNREWESSSIDLLSGITAIGTYEVEVFFDATTNGVNADGTVYRSNNSNNYIGTFSLTVVLPISLTTFTATPLQHLIQLDWATASEINNDYFTIEKSINGETFEAIGTVQGNGTTLEAQGYRFEDKNPTSGLSYYRLAQTDYDGTTTYSPIITTEFAEEKTINIYPNPADKQLFMTNESPVDVQIYNLQGQIIRSVTSNSGTPVDISDLAKGMYLIKIRNNNSQQIITTKKIMIQ